MKNRHRDCVALFACVLAMASTNVSAHGSKRIAVKMETDRFVAQLRLLNGPEEGCWEQRQGEYSSTRCDWSNGQTLLIETQPPETTSRIWTIKRGLPEQEVLRVLQAHAEAIGIPIQWDRPDRVSFAKDRVVEYIASNPGWNGIARMKYDRNNKVVRASLSIAL